VGLIPWEVPSQGYPHPHTDLNKPAKFHGACANLAGCSNPFGWDPLTSTYKGVYHHTPNSPIAIQSSPSSWGIARRAPLRGGDFNSPPCMPRCHILGASPNLGGHNHGVTWADYALDCLVIAHRSKDSPSGRKNSWAGPLPPPCPVRATSLASLISPLRLALVCIRVGRSGCRIT
jgi:hypothetical protein